MEKKVKEMTKDEAKLWFEAERIRLAEERKAARLKYWNELPKFEGDIKKIPELPAENDPETWKNFYCAKLIEAGAIEKKNLVDGKFYAGDHRRATIARWNFEKNRFEYWRTKFNARYIDYCNHFEDDDGFALFVPIKEATEEQFERNAE